MQREQDLTVRARTAIARWWPVRALPGRQLHMKASAADGGTTTLLAVATLCAQIMLGCGDERPPWSGFPIFPPDAGGFELSPELASGLLAAQAAFVKQIAEQGAPDAGHVSSGATSPIAAGRASAGTEAPKPPPPRPNDNAGDRDEKPSMAAAPAPPAKPDDTGESAMPNQGAPVDAGVMPQPPMAADSGMQMPLGTSPAADGGMQTAPDAGPSPPAAGSTPPPPPDAGEQTPTIDAGTLPPTAGSAAPTSAVDAGAPTSDADGGN